MYKIIFGYERDKYFSLFESMFRLRHQVFVLNRQWSLASRNGLEIDEYDNEDAVYFLSLDEDERIEACARMTPSARSSLLADYFPHLNETPDASRSDKIYEATRYIVQPQVKSHQAIRDAKARLIIPLVEWCYEKELSHLQAVVDFGALGSFVEMTLQTQPLGMPHPYGGGRGAPGGGDCIAFRWPINEDVLGDLYDYGRAANGLQAELALN